MASDPTNLNVQRFLSISAPSVLSDTSTTAEGNKVYDGTELHLVHPALPTAAGDANVSPLLGSDLHGRLFGVIDVLIIPDLLDLGKFKRALAKALALYPTFAGRLRHDASSGQWSIALTNSAVPVHVHREADLPHNDEEDWAVLGMNVGALIEPVKQLNLVNSDEPLMTVKLSYSPATNETAVGIMISHIVADGLYAKHFEVALSAFYSSDPSPPSPLPISRLTLHPAPSIPDPSTPLPPGASPEGELYDDIMASMAGTVPLNIRIDLKRVAGVKKSIVESLGKEEEGWLLSAQDVITAIVVGAINRADAGHIEQVLTMVNFRDNPLISPLPYGGNSIVSGITPSLPLHSQTDPTSLARAIRESVLELRAGDGEVLRERFRTAQEAGLAWSNKGYSRRITQPRGRAIVNSIIKIDRLETVHFGYHGRVRYHTGFLGHRYIRMTRSNPHIVNGQVVDSRDGVVDVQFLVDAKIVDAVRSGIEEMLASMSGSS